jgi:hypothetical protein
METYQRTIFAIVRLGFILVPILGIVITVANAFDHPLRSGEVGAAAFIFMIGIAGFFATRLIQRVVLSNRP